MRTLADIRAVISGHQAELLQRYRARIVGVFGSYVRGEQRDDSDLDLLAQFDENASLFDLGGAQAMLSELLGVKVDLVPREDVRPELRDAIESETLKI